MMNLGQVGVCGFFKIEAFKGVKDKHGVVHEKAGTRRVAADWFPNLVTDQGLERIGDNRLGYLFGNDSMYYCHVGTGSTTPANTDTGLASFLASTATTQAQGDGAQGSAPYYAYMNVTKRFGEGVAAGNLSEIGMGWGSSGNTLFSRALILDGSSSPTTITVLPDEYLDVTYEFRIYPPTGDATGTITLDGVVYDYTARASRVTLNSGNGWGNSSAGNQALDSGSGYRAYDGNIGAITGSPSGNEDGIAATSDLTSESYVAASLEGSVTAAFGLNVCNFASGIRSVRITVGWTTWQIEFSAQSDSSAIPKDNTQVLTLTVTHSWARKSI